MAKLGISTGSSPNDGTGDSLIDGAVKINSNFNEIYTAIGDGSALSVPVTSLSAGNGIQLSGSTGGVTITNTGVANTNNLRTNFLEVSGISTLNSASVTGNITAATFSGNGAAITGISTLNITNYGVGLGGGGSSYTNADVDTHLNRSSASNGEVLSWNGSDYAWVTNSGTASTANVLSDRLVVTGVTTAQGGLHVGLSTDNAADSSMILGGGAGTQGINFTGVNSTDINSTYYKNIRAAKVGNGFRYDLEFHTNGYSSGDIGDFIFYKRETSSGRTEKMRLSGESGDLIVGTGTSTARVQSPALKLDHNNPTVVGSAGTTGEIKQIGGVPYYHDGTAWRQLFLIDAVTSVNTADTDWDNTMIRMNFDQANIGALTNLKDGVAPYSTSTTDLVSSPVKYGTKSARFPANNTGIQFDQNNGGNVRYSFEGPWTIEGWFLFDAAQLTNNTTTPSATKLFANFNSSTGTGTNWDVGVYYSGSSNTYRFYWHNNASSNTGSGQAGNSGTGFVLRSVASSVFADNNWHHIALVREPGNGSIHFYLDGTEGIETNNDELIENDINDATNKVFALGYHSHSNVGTGWFDGNIDDFRVSNVARYTGNFTPPSAALPITGSTTTIVTPPDSKVGELALGNSPAWTGTPGVTPTRVAAGHYRATFATAYSNATDYVIQATMNDYTPVTTAVGIGVSRFTTHADFYVNRVSDGATIDTGSIAIDLYKK